MRIAAAAAALGLSGCTAAGALPPVEPARAASVCAGTPVLGRFDTARDLLIANYDSKPDVDDLQAVAAFGAILRDPQFSCINYIATHGAYGIQGGELLPAESLFDLAFGDNWIDAHADRERAIDVLVRRAQQTIESGGKVWVAEAGQSDVTAAMVRRLRQEEWTSVNVVQHSFWNESHTSADAIQLVVYNTRYHRVSDGNFAGNGSPAFNTDDGSHWNVLLADPQSGHIWREAKRLSDVHNPVAAYVNPAVAAGGLDFSDTVEMAYIFGFEDMHGVEDYVARFAAPPP